MHIDFLGPLTQTLNGNSYVGLAVCALTKYVEAAGKIANTKLTFLNIRIPLRFKPTTTPPPWVQLSTSYMSIVFAHFLWNFLNKIPSIFNANP